MSKIKYAVVGTGGRIPMFIDPIAETYHENAQIVGFCDPSPTRMKWHLDRLVKAYDYADIPCYGIDDFDKMLVEQQPDVVIVCTPDYLHRDYIVKSMEHGCDVITEKPLTIDAESCAIIMEAVERTGRHLRTAFNYRWQPGASKVRELIGSGTIGKVIHVDFEYMLNTIHGADYYRRWHSDKSCSGGLFIHKATHHFDLINWWLDAIPESVYALGELAFYGKENAIARGQEAWTKYDRYTGVEAAKKDPFALRMDEDETLKQLYYNAEADSGYIRDKNVFRDGITIEDTMSALIKYRTGVVANYSLNSYCPREGFVVTINGDGGRIEYEERSASHIITGDKEIRMEANHKRSLHLKVQKLFGEPYEVPIEEGPGGHGGGDPLLQEQMFAKKPTKDELGRNAAHEQGAASILVGVAANQSMESKLPVNLNDLWSLSPEAKHLHELA
ncbi:Gfo/Idh/MocA family oxidoreductase [Coraliomargarita sp. SDUM461004]|uniref:Gfo/Idh/MocA family oxidoreductase n=1 Tax=Thalassobacterium sedimentorum TaxID=3041258 RepID=A0ABU1AJ75_9BACT|nr:Gfo/Idh/MocA family oxidoreductase [Coraliomargarita sp. SDUM461004]MDQ8194804.1 Gfo/Idh/MocA family oxidoreductase [Coraliomargarita sp. SDUM461004]